MRDGSAQDWYGQPAASAYEALRSGPEGLSEAEAARRLAETGPNALPRAPSPSPLVMFARQFRSPLIAVLVIAGAFSLAVGEVVDAGFIAAVLLLNAVIGAVQEWRAERGVSALQHMLRVAAVVVRDGEARTIEAQGLVPGDVVLLEPGQRTPADLRLTRAHALEADESLLTGESMPAAKDAAWVGKGRVPLGDRCNMVHAGTHIVRGRGAGVVVATGRSTQVGRIARDVMAGDTGEAPLLVRMRRFARLVGMVVLAAAGMLAAIGVLRGEPVRDMAMFAVAVAVSAVPEGLPVALTIALTVATRRMASRHVIVRRLAAVEALGSCTLIATDKTGTLTCNALTVLEVRTAEGARYEVTGDGFEPVGEVRRGGRAVTAEGALRELARTVVLCNEADLTRPGQAWTWRGDPTDVALLAFAAKLGIHAEPVREEEPQVNEIPFEPERRFAGTLHKRPGGVGVMHVKGAPERVLSMCDATAAKASAWMREAEAMADEGLRVLAVASGPASPEAEGAPPEPAGLTFLGLVGMKDPPRPGVREAIEAALAAGLRVVMVTGDHPSTARSIAREVGIPEGGICTGPELEEWSDEELAARVAGTTVFARVAPHQKLQIVHASQRAGHFVAVTGDGVNDAPALRAAHVGVAMGRDGTDVAREAAEIVIADDAFPSVVAGVEEGRVAYQNVRNVVFLLISTGAAEVVLVLLALLTGNPLPLLPAQLLWLNLVTNGIQHVALGMEPGQGDELDRPPRHPQEGILDRVMVERTVLGAAVMGVVGFGVFQWLIAAGWDVDAARNLLLLLMVLFENLHVFNSRSETKSIFALSPLRNPFLVWSIVGAQGIHIVALYVPFLQRVLGTAPVTLETWGTLLLVAATVSIAFEVQKTLRRRWPVRKGPVMPAV